MTAHPAQLAGADPLPPPVAIRNEFSLVELSYVRNGVSLELVVSDADSGDHVTLGAAELATLARAPHEAFRRLLRAIDDHNDAAPRLDVSTGPRGERIADRDSEP